MERVLLKEKLIKILFIISGASLTVFLSIRGNIKYEIVGLFFSIIFLIIISFKKDSLINININNINRKLFFVLLILSVVTSIYILDSFLVFVQNQYGIYINQYRSVEYYLLLAFPLYFLVVWYRYFYNKIRFLFNTINNDFKKYEKIIVILFFIIFSIAGLVLFLNTTIFTTCTSTEGWHFPYDVLYTTDSPMIVFYDAFANVNSICNDIRQPLFGVFSLPFAIISHIISFIFSFIINEKFLYFYMMFVIQVAISQICVMLVVKIINANKLKTILLTIFINSTYCLLLFTFVAEQYIFSIFWLIIFIYLYIKHDVKDVFFSIASAGSLISNIVVYPLIVFCEKKNCVKKCIIYFLVFIVVLSLFGQFHYIPNSLSMISFDIESFGGKYIFFIDKLKQYLYFVRSMFLAPGGYFYWQDNYICFYRQILANNNSILGIIILMVCIISYVINQHKKEIKIAGIWVLFSFFIICIIGWGTAENGTLLYSYYFIWPFVILLSCLLKKINNSLFTILMCLMIIVMLFFNIAELTKIVIFGCKYYKTIFDYLI